MNSSRAGFLMVGFIYIVFLVCPLSVNGQYAVRGEVVCDDASLDDVKVDLQLNDSHENLPIRAGRFFTQLKWDQVYYLSFRKPGFVTKIIEFSTKVPDDYPKELLQPYVLQVRLFPVFEGVDTVFFEKPVAKIRFDESMRDFSDDRDYSLQVRYKVEEMRKNGMVEKKVGSAQKVKAKPVVKPGSVKDIKSLVNTTTASIKEVDVKVEAKQAPKSDLIEKLHLPRLKEVYPTGKTVEEFDLEGRHIVRTIFFDGDFRRVLVEVKHDWGAVYYFIDELHIGSRCITKEAYLAEIENEILYFKNKE